MVSGVKASSPRITRETVPMETPASFAMLFKLTAMSYQLSGDDGP